LGAELRGDKDAAFLVDMRRMYENALRSAQSGKPGSMEQYSISSELDKDLQAVLDGTFESDKGEVYTGETSNFLVEDIGANSLPEYIPPKKAYAAMVSEEDARAADRYEKNTNYHALGKEGLMQALEASENPVAAFAAPPDEKGNKRLNRIVLVTDMTVDGEPIVVIEEVETNAYAAGKRVTANKQITVYPREQIANDILKAAEQNRLLHLDKKRSQPLNAGIRGSNSLVAIRQVDFKDNIRRFWDNVNWKKSGKTHVTFGDSSGKTAVELAFEKAQTEKDARDSSQNATGRNFQELSDDVFEELTRAEPPETEDRSVMERLRQKDLDEYWEEVERLADAIADEDDANMDPNPDPEDLVQTDVQREKVPLREKVEDVRSFIARKFFDAGDAVTQIQKQTGDRHLYSYFNQARASANAAVQMIEGNRFDTLGRNTGDGLNKVLETVRSKGAEYYKDFQLYLLHMHNIDRMQRENPERVDAARASFERFKAENPDLAQFADYQISRMAAEETSPYYFVAGEYMRYLQAMQRAENTRNSPVFGHHVTAQDSRAAADRLLRENPEFREEAEKVYAYIDNLLRYRVDSGLITEKDYNALKAIYPHYVPTYRTLDKAGIDTREAGTVQVGKTIGRSTGGDEKIMPLHIALARQTMNVVREGSKNRFGQRLMNGGSARTKYVQNVEEYEGDFREDTFDELEDKTPKKNNTFIVREDGKLYQITVSPELYEAVKALSPDSPENNFFLNGARKFNRAFKALTTGKKPTFLISNFSRDIQDAMLYSKDLGEFVKQYPQAWKEITTNGEYWQLYKALGGIYSSFFERGREADIGEGGAV
ncbi:MAG: hypothetical protein IKC04_07155, partial [Oscillospiraceae bacterium]|nr:hypothetical protein [Oscillospiraceae bacterium]